MAGSMNPQISTIEIGIKKLREVTIYPLSMADQVKMSDVITTVMTEFEALEAANKQPSPSEDAEADNVDQATEKSINDVVFVTSVVKLIEGNLERILKFVVDETEAIDFAELSNEQFSDLVTKIYEVNYESSIKKFKTLLGKVAGNLQKTS